MAKGEENDQDNSANKKITINNNCENTVGFTVRRPLAGVDGGFSSWLARRDRWRASAARRVEGGVRITIMDIKVENHNLPKTAMRV